MCKYCDDLSDREIKIPIRTAMADDNICELASPDENHIFYDCKNCNGCSDENQYFSINIWEDNLCFSYFHKIRDIIIAPISARFNINYCPMCCKRISNKKNDSDELKFW